MLVQLEKMVTKVFKENKVLMVPMLLLVTKVQLDMVLKDVKVIKVLKVAKVSKV